MQEAIDKLNKKRKKLMNQLGIKVNKKKPKHNKKKKAKMN